MLKMIYLLVTAVLFLGACQQQSISKENKTTTENNKIHTVKSISNIVPYQIKAEQLHTVVGFLSEVDLLIIEQHQNREQLVRYNLETGKKKILYTSDDAIIQVLIHPSMKEILVQTANNSESANVTIITVAGKILHNFNVKSQEISLVWNPNNTNLVGLSAFNNDFSYNSYIYDGSKNKLVEFQSDNPFWTWYSDNILWVNKMGNNPLNGGTLTTINWRNGKVTSESKQKIVYVSCFKQSSLIVTMDFTKEEFRYVLEKGNKKQEWTSPAVTDYAQWFVPEVQWLDDQSLMVLLPMENGKIDEGEHPFKLVHVSLNCVHTIGQSPNYEQIICSAKGTLCLSGNNYETAISIKPYEKKKWLVVKD